MSSTDPLSSASENDPNLGEDDRLAPMTPGSLERKPILGGQKKSKSSKPKGSSGPTNPTSAPAETGKTPEAESTPPAAPAGGEASGKKKKVHAPDPLARAAQTILPLGGDNDLDDLPDLPDLSTVPDSRAMPGPSSAPEPPTDGIESAIADPSPDTTEEQTPVEVTPEPNEAIPEPTAVDAPADEESPSSGGIDGAARTTQDEFSSALPASPGRETSGSPRWSLDGGERKWMILLLAGLLVTGVFFYVMLRSGLPSSSVHLAQTNPDLPIEGAKVTIEVLDIDWKDTGSDSVAGGLTKNTLFPRVTLRFKQGSAGAVRIFFRDEREHQVGDTENFEVGQATLERVVTCTEGLRSRIEYDGLRSRENNRWTLEIYEGSNPQGPLSEFTLLVRVNIPWNLARNPSP